ncbi:MAG: hypothetical protein LBG59_05380 [Candidatus Peribacteria bacterium]|jgi:hypothetical protein|nr:hypothetical protein [Candidatus Peribacteria bacterium]
MIIKEIKGDIFQSEDKHIVFALNTEGYNDSGFAGAVCRKGFKEIANTGGNTLGTMLSKKIGEKTYYGIVCHSLHDGWNDAAKIILRALDELPTTDNISAVLMGSSLVGLLSNVPVEEIYKAFEKSKKNISVYSF